VYSARGNQVGKGNDFSEGGLSYIIDQIVTFSPRPAVISVSMKKDCWIFGLFCGTTMDDALEDAVDAGITVVVSAANKLLYSKPLALIATIPGATSLGQYTYCSWSVDLQGGEPPYTFLWNRDGTPVSTGSGYSVGPAGSSGFVLDLLVTDGVGRTATAIKSIVIDPMDYSFAC
jgi:hypothetical protein